MAKETTQSKAPLQPKASKIDMLKTENDKDTTLNFLIRYQKTNKAKINNSYDWPWNSRLSFDKTASEKSCVMNVEINLRNIVKIDSQYNTSNTSSLTTFPIK